MLQLYTLNYYTSLINIGYTSAVVPGFRYSQTKDKNMVNIEKQQTNPKSWLIGMTGTFPSWERYSLLPELGSVRHTYEPNSTSPILNHLWKQNEMRIEKIEVWETVLNTAGNTGNSTSFGFIRISFYPYKTVALQSLTRQLDISVPIIIFIHHSPTVAVPWTGFCPGAFQGNTSFSHGHMLR